LDTPRRWQVASLVTAAVSLGIGALSISRPSVEPVAPIVIDLVAGGYATQEPSGTSGLHLVPTPAETAGAEPTVVEPTVVEPLTPASLASVQSVASPEEPATSVGPAAPPPAPPPPASTPTAREQRVDSPDDVDSPASIDS
jgi:hypothetical protein